MNQKFNKSKSSRGQALRAQKRSVEDASKVASQYQTAASNGTARHNSASGASDQKKGRANLIDDSPRLKIIGLGGMDGGGSKNTIIVEYKDEAVVMDCGNDLGVDLPGVNYGIADMSYLDSIKHKLKAYLITHGHLDHIGGLPHILHKYPAPVYGSSFTIGMVEKIFENFGVELPENFKLKTVIMNEHNHERLKIGQFFVEMIRITHSIPGSCAIALDTPAGRIVNTGDFRLDPSPLDQEKTDLDRLKQLGKEGVLLLMSESTTSERPGRTPSESTIEPSLKQVMDQAPGRTFIALFSSNIKRIQMIVDAAVYSGRKVAMDGRSMMNTLETAVKQGMIKVPKGTFVPISSVNGLRDDKVIVICTGSQGEPNSALQRMSTGDHNDIKLKPHDTVVLSSTPIPETGNDKKIGIMVDELMRKGLHVFRHETHDLDGIGPLHVSGHASIEEYREMIDMLKPKFFVPIYGAYRSKQRHIEVAVEQGIPRKHCVNANNGDVIQVSPNKIEIHGHVPHGTILVDQTGAVVNNVVVKDRVMLANEGLVSVILTIDKKSGKLITSPDIISRGFIYMKDEEGLMKQFREELRRAVAQRFRRIDLDRFKLELKEHITHFLFDKTGRSPIVIPVINVIGYGGAKSKKPSKAADSRTPEKEAKVIQKRFDEMRSRLLNQDPRVD